MQDNLPSGHNALAANAPIPVVEIGRDGVVRSANATACALAGVAVDDPGMPARVRAILPGELGALLADVAGADEPVAATRTCGARAVSWTLQHDAARELVLAWGYEITGWARSEAALQRKDALLHAVARAAHVILYAPPDELPLDEVIGELGLATGVSRIYVFRNHVDDGDLLASQVAEWTNTGVEPQIDNPELQNVPYEAAGMGRWASELAAGRTLAGTIDEFPPSEQDLLRPQGILSLVVTPITVAGTPWGFIGFDDCEVSRHWSAAELDILRTAADLVAGAIDRGMTIAHLEESRAQLRHVQRMDAVGRLAAGIAHDFNNIMSGILGFSELLLARTAADDPSRDDLDEIRKAALRAASLTRQLLTFSKKQVERPQSLDLPDLLGGMRGLLDRLLGSNVSIAMETADDVPRVRADPGQLEQIVMNLVVNARDAMPQGGSILITTARSGLSAPELEKHGLDKERDYVLLSVRDTGTGMDAETVRKAFEPFFTTKRTGTGMGLSIIYGIVRQCGGSVWISSAPNAGTTVMVALPAAGSDAKEDVTADDIGALGLEQLAGDETILLVDDDAVVCKIAERVLQLSGYRVLLAATASEGLDTLRTHAEDIDLVLSDFGLPDRSGTEFAAEIAALFPTVPVAFISGYPGQRTDDEEFDAPVPEFLAKPFTREQLLRHVRRWLDV